MQKLGIFLSAAITAFAQPTVSLAQTSQPTLAETEAGMVRGQLEDDVISFRGIPFAAPPVGPLRWRAPQPVERWQGVRDASNDAYDCAQEPAPGIAAPLQAPLSEDCLYLNLWRPAAAKLGAKLPVMVWIHGGGFVNGGISPSVFNGKYFARRGVLIISVNYRLGRFGFFAHPALTAEVGGKTALGNYGIMDQIAALKWVQRNVRGFGGDPDKVTIFGESAGGMSVNFLLTSRKTRNLFRGAIIQSGGGRISLSGAGRLSQDLPGKPSLESTGLSFAKANGIDGADAKALAQLRMLPEAAVVGGLNMFTSAAQATTYGGPVIDGQVIERWPDGVFASGEQHRVPIIVGATNDDLGVLTANSKVQVFSLFKSKRHKAQAAFDPTGLADEKLMVRRVAQQRAMIEPARFVSRSFASKGLKAYHFRFSYVAKSMRAELPFGAPHATDVPFVMGTVAEKYGSVVDESDLKMGEIINAYWANFASNLDPNGPGLPRWTPAEVRDKRIMEFTVERGAVMREDPLSSQLDLIEMIQPTAK